MPGLLADPKRIKSALGQIMHNTGKTLARSQIDALYDHYKPVLEHKEKTGWIKDDVRFMWDSWKLVESMYDHPINDKIFGWHRNPEDRNRQMYHKVVSMACLLMDEDSAYHIPFMIWLKHLHENWDKLEVSVEAAYQILNFGDLYKDLLALAEPLPQDDGKDEPQIDYIRREKEILAKKDGIE